jgi:hypothetical protein
VAVEPEEVLVQERVAALGGIEEAGVEDAVGEEHRQCAGEDRCADQLEPGGDQVAQQNSGIRNHFMPGARMLLIVTMKLIAPRIELMPAR